MMEMKVPKNMECKYCNEINFIKIVSLIQLLNCLCYFCQNGRGEIFRIFVDYGKLCTEI